MTHLVDEQRLEELKFLYDGYAAEGCSSEEMFKFPVRDILHSLSLALAVVRAAQNGRFPNCPDQGWYEIRNRNTGEPEQEQCEWCCTTPNSLFRALAPFQPPSDAGTQGEKEKS